MSELHDLFPDNNNFSDSTDNTYAASTASDTSLVYDTEDHGLDSDTTYRDSSASDDSLVYDTEEDMSSDPHDTRTPKRARRLNIVSPPPHNNPVPAVAHAGVANPNPTVVGVIYCNNGMLPLYDYFPGGVNNRTGNSFMQDARNCMAVIHDVLAIKIDSKIMGSTIISSNLLNYESFILEGVIGTACMCAAYGYNQRLDGHMQSFNSMRAHFQALSDNGDGTELIYLNTVAMRFLDYAYIPSIFFGWFRRHSTTKPTAVPGNLY